MEWVGAGTRGPDLTRRDFIRGDWGEGGGRDLVCVTTRGGCDGRGPEGKVTDRGLVGVCHDQGRRSE